MERLYQTLNATESLLNDMERTFDLMKLSEKGIASGFRYQNKLLVFTGAVYQCGLQEISGHEVVPLKSYKGDVPAVTREEHWNLVQQGKRERGYNGQIVKINNIPHVLIDPKYRFIKTIIQEKQLELF